ncbi:MAG TPA: lipocalin-like domain-containing protein [Candidatus Rubrimentiphilum sp.]|nr:lipocalin-like domain-containing protein [Candidatus Rubrimentiphilum sp.]
MKLVLAAALAFAVASSPYAFHFPADHGSHPAYQSEWWYFTGHLRSADGRRFGYEVTFFRLRLRPKDKALATKILGRSRWRGDEVYAAHFAITDQDGRKFFHAERIARSALGMGASAAGRLAVNVDEWSLTGQPMSANDRERMVLHAADGDNRLDLVQVPLKRPAIHGRDGIFRKGACPSCASRYYSYSRLHSQGTLVYGGASLKVSGTSWMDHEFGTDQLESEETGWDWMSLQLNDGREVMLYLFRRPDNSIEPQSSGSLIDRDGSVHPLSLNQFQVTATSRWRSPVTHAQYPSSWHVRVPSASLNVTITPVLADQEFALRSSPSYWEGAVDIRDAANSRSLGQGYVELTGYVERVIL